MFRPSIPAMLALVLAFAAAPVRAEAPPRVVASIQPVQSLVAAVMEGVGMPRVLARAGGSPHVAHLRPSEAMALNAADIVFWIGPGLETYLERPLAALDGATVVALADSPGLASHARRHGDQPDPHIWLDPVNGVVIAAAVADSLAAADPANAATYHTNAAALANSLQNLDRDIAARLAPLHGVTFLTFHDAYFLFERRYGLAGMGAVTVRVGQPQSAHRVAALRAQIRRQDIRCLFVEPEFAPALVETLIEGTGVQVATLDPLASAITPGPDAYETALRADARAIAQCLGGD